MASVVAETNFHNHAKQNESSIISLATEPKFTYTFDNHFHPFVGELIEQLNKRSLDGLLDVNFHATLVDDFFKEQYLPNETDKTVEVICFPKEIDVSEAGSYAVYNWELFFHVPLTIAMHLSKNQRFAEAQRWFHYIFDPTSNDKMNSGEEHLRFWKFLKFRQIKNIKQIDDLLYLLSKPKVEGTDEALLNDVMSGYEKIREEPFHPHVVARTRHLAYQYCTVMKYLDNLIAWGDSLFRQDTIETINEATQLYVLAANILGPRPQRIPPRGTTKPMSFADLRANKLDTKLGNAWIELEGQFPFNLYFPKTTGVNTEQSKALFGMGHALYFCIPQNDKLLGYWDTVADRLFKIRHCMNIEGVVRQLPLFEPPIDPGMLVKAAAAGIDISSLVSGLNQPLSPVRATLLIQKALEICSEVRGMGAGLLSALEKQEAEKLAILRQQHEINIQQMVQDVRYLQWKEAEEATESLLKSRAITLERYRHYQRLLGKDEAAVSELEILAVERKQLSEANFDEIYGELVGQYELELELEKYPPLEIKGDGKLFLNKNEDAALNEHAPEALSWRQRAIAADTLFAALVLLPSIGIDFHYWGIGGHSEQSGGTFYSNAGRIASNIANSFAIQNEGKGAAATQTASYERRSDDWIQQINLAARELMQIGRQIISSLIREQITYHEYKIQQRQIEQSQEIDRFLREQKFTNDELYKWMQGELSKLYYEYYKFAFDIARKAEQTMKHELMRPELDELNFIKFNYWDGGRKGLLSGETLYLDLKRMEMAYHDHNKREYELTKHVSLRQLDPLALLSLKATGTCEVTLPEWLFDFDAPGHYMRRIKNVSLSIPSVTGPYTSVNCTLSLLKSSLRRSPLLADGGYSREPEGSEDSRFVDYYGTIQSVVTSSANNDSGLFETNLRDERYLPFENAGACSTWRLELPSEFRQFDYNTISDVILHIRYTARQGGAQLRQAAVGHLQELVEEADTSGLVQFFSLRHEFSSEWHRFLHPAGATDYQTLTLSLHKERFPYLIQDKIDQIHKIELFIKVDPDFATTHNQSTLKFTLEAGETAPNPSNAQPTDLLPLAPWNGMLRSEKPFADPPGSWTINAWLNDEDQLDAKALEDVLLVCHYSIAAP